jgi:hypothetical protein
MPEDNLHVTSTDREDENNKFTCVRYLAHLNYHNGAGNFHGTNSEWRRHSGHCWSLPVSATAHTAVPTWAAAAAAVQRDATITCAC